MGLEERLPGGILLSTVEKVAGYGPQGIRCGQRRSACMLAPSR